MCPEREFQSLSSSELPPQEKALGHLPKIEVPQNPIYGCSKTIVPLGLPESSRGDRSPHPSRAKLELLARLPLWSSGAIKPVPSSTEIGASDVRPPHTHVTTVPAMPAAMKARGSKKRASRRASGSPSRTSTRGGGAAVLGPALRVGAAQDLGARVADQISTHMHATQFRQVDVFRRADRNSSGYLSFGELRAALDAVGLELTDQEVAAFIGEVVDTNGDGKISIEEFLKYLRHAKRGTSAQKPARPPSANTSRRSKSARKARPAAVARRAAEDESAERNQSLEDENFLLSTQLSKLQSTLRKTQASLTTVQKWQTASNEQSDSRDLDSSKVAAGGPHKAVDRSAGGRSVSWLSDLPPRTATKDDSLDQQAAETERMRDAVEAWQDVSLDETGIEGVVAAGVEESVRLQELEGEVSTLRSAEQSWAEQKRKIEGELRSHAELWDENNKLRAEVAGAKASAAAAQSSAAEAAAAAAAAAGAFAASGNTGSAGYSGGCDSSDFTADPLLPSRRALDLLVGGGLSGAQPWEEYELALEQIEQLTAERNKLSTRARKDAAELNQHRAAAAAGRAAQRKAETASAAHLERLAASEEAHTALGRRHGEQAAAAARVREELHGMKARAAEAKATAGKAGARAAAAEAEKEELQVEALRLRTEVWCSRSREFCHYADIPSPSLLKEFTTTGRGGAAE